MLLDGLPLSLIEPLDLGIDLRVEESGESYEENARMKAVAYADASGLVSLADDSGLEVNALGGEPGVKAARYAGEGATDEQRVGYLLEKLKGVPMECRQAHFVCVIAIARPGTDVELCRGECEGVIALESRGDRGFGYDPVFYLPDLGVTMAELSPAVKNEISHRGKAAREARRVLERMLGEGWI
ncbi:MAG: RdgB/HAM1 family non-canonical purine NTP pyrophosphatase [Chloroflexi bacterium]|nr:RdgB/HAM1 family non-canonical purine NTP pyrophosphatase [Chloroflexota bacterium]